MSNVFFLFLNTLLHVCVRLLGAHCHMETT